MLAIIVFGILFFAAAILTPIRWYWLAVFVFLAATTAAALGAATKPETWHSRPEDLWMAYASVALVVNVMCIMIGREIRKSAVNNIVIKRWLSSRD